MNAEGSELTEAEYYEYITPPTGRELELLERTRTAIEWWEAGKMTADEARKAIYEASGISAQHECDEDWTNDADGRVYPLPCWCERS